MRASTPGVPGALWHARVVDGGRASARQAALEGAGAEVMQAVPTMLELVPAGINKWVGMRALLADLARALPARRPPARGAGACF